MAISTLTLTIGLLFIGQAAALDSRDQFKVKQLLATILTPEYNVAVRPYGVNGTEATYVSLNLADINVLGVDEVLGRFTAQGYFRLQWVDPRLAYNDTSISYLPINDCKSIWTPDLYTLNEVETAFGGKPSSVLRVYPDGRVYYSIRITRTLSCPLAYNKEKELTCGVSFGSYGYSSDEFVIQFKDQDVNVLPNIFVPRYTFNGVTLRSCDYSVKNIGPGSHLHSCAGLDFRFTRTAV